MKVATDANLKGNDWKLYEYITRHFIASVSNDDCTYTEITIIFDIGRERFYLTGFLTPSS
jgi:DNA topoisomerase-3